MNKYYICVPVYNVEMYLDECIKSVVNQTYHHFRLVLVDDGSHDHSGEICEKYAKKDNRIHVIHQKNQGLMAARNTARKYIMEQKDLSSAYIIYLDSDDSLQLNALEIINNTFERENCDMVVYGVRRVCNGEIICKWKNSYIGILTNKRELYKLVFQDSRYNPLWRKAVSAKLLFGTDYSFGYNICQGEDLLQSIAYYEKCQKPIFIKDILYNYTVNANSITENVKYENFEVNSLVQQIVWKFLKQQNVWSKRDFEQYFKYRRKALKRDIKRVAVFNIKSTEKELMFDKLYLDEFNNMVLKSKKQKDILLNLFSVKAYTLVCYICNISETLMSVCKFIKRWGSGFIFRKRCCRKLKCYLL